MRDSRLRRAQHIELWLKFMAIKLNTRFNSKCFVNDDDTFESKMYIKFMNDLSNHEYDTDRRDLIYSYYCTVNEAKIDQVVELYKKSRKYSIQMYIKKNEELLS